MYEQISQILVESFQIRPAELRPDTTLDELGMDSLEVVELGMALGDLGAQVTEDELIAAQRLDAIGDLVARRAAAA